MNSSSQHHRTTSISFPNWRCWLSLIWLLVVISGPPWPFLVDHFTPSAGGSIGAVEAYHSLPALSSNEHNTLCNDIHCLHGTCRNGKCICDKGWHGKLCHICGGRVRLDEPFGYISDGKKNYTTDLQCTWLIDARRFGNQSIIRLKFTEFETECSWDHLYIFKGDSLFSPLVAAFSGILTRKTLTQGSAELPEIEIHGGFAYVYFYSDTAYYMSGFNLSYTIVPCRQPNCNALSSSAFSSSTSSFLTTTPAGVLLPSSLLFSSEIEDANFEVNHCHASLNDGGKLRNLTSLTNCNCNDGLNSLRCTHQICPNKCSLHGDCDSQLRSCVCKEGFAGADCGQIKLEGYWEALNFLKKQIVLGRALHQTVVLNDDMWVVGGEFFDKTLVNEQFLMKFDFTQQTWTNFSHPLRANLRRFGHSLVVYEDSLYMYGGMLEDGSIGADLWIYTVSTNQWNQLITDNSPRVCYNQFCAPLSVVGHSSTIVAERMYVIFGYNPRFGYLNSIQEYNFQTKKWTMLNPAGALVKGGFGHSSVYHHDTRMIYVYGGHHSAGSDSVLVDHLYGFSPQKNKWSVFFQI